MFPLRRALLIGLFLPGLAFAAPKSHVTILGRWRRVIVSAEDDQSRPIKVRALRIDGRFKEYTAGPIHEVTERLFVVRKIEKLNDSLPDDTGHSSRWVWRLDGWISVDRTTGHISQLNLPGFDPDWSQASWYRDYVAYCGASDPGKIYMFVAQMGRRRPILKHEYAGSACGLPKWERTPLRVTFTGTAGSSSFALHAHAELQSQDSNEGGRE